MSFEEITYEVRDGAAVVTMNRPAKKNAMSPRLRHELLQALDLAEADPEARVLVLTGAGGNFCAGADISHFGDPEEGDHTAEYKRYFEFAKPTIAAVDGYALGGGAEYALLSDLIVATERAKFGFVGPRVGATCSYANIRLSQELGRAKAKELLFTCDVISAQDALAVGLINKVVPAEGLLPAVFEYVEKIRKAAPLALRIIKEGTNRNDHDFEFMRRTRQQIMESDDLREGRQAFLEKRPPRFVGR